MPAVAAIFGAFDEDVPAPPGPRNLYEEGRGTVAAQRQLLPDQYAYDAEALRLYQPLYQGLYDEITRRGTESDLDLVDAYTGRSRQAIRNFNPNSAAALDSVSALDAEQLASGINLTPFEQRGIEQGLRSGYSARGLSLGGGDAAREALNAYAGGNARRQQWRDNSVQSARAQYDMYGDPFTRLVGSTGATRGSKAVMASVGGLSKANPWDPYAADLYNTNYNAQWGAHFDQRNRNQEQKANVIALDSAVLGAVGSAAGAM